MRAGKGPRGSLGSLSGPDGAFAVAGGVANRVEPVAASPDGHDFESKLAEAAELLPQPPDVDVDGFAVAQVVVTPYLLQQDLPREDAAGPPHQVGEEFPFLGGQLQLGVVDHGAPPGPVDPQPAKPVLLHLGAHVPLLAA